jgi:hypothetical protein
VNAAAKIGVAITPSVFLSHCKRQVTRDLVALCVALVLGVFSPPAAAQILVVMSDGSAGYQAVAEELRNGVAALRDGHTRVDIATAPRLASVDDQAFNAYELVVTVGLAAAQATTLRENSLPAPPLTLCLLIPHQSFERLASTRTSASARRLSALFIDQPLSRQLDLLRIALPDRHRVGVILGPSSQGLADELHSRARERGLSLNIAKVSEASSVYGALQTVIPESDLLLLLPDAVATNADTVYGLLLTSYRAQVPVIGFSAGLHNAGALVSLYSTARQQGRQGAEIASRVLTNKDGLPAPQYPKYFTVQVNASVAHSLGLHLPTDEALSDALSGHSEGTGTPPPRAGDDAATPRGEP